MSHAALPDYLTIKQACAWLSVSRRTLYNWMDAGKVQYVRTAGGSRRILRESLVREDDLLATAAAAEALIDG